MKFLAILLFFPIVLCADDHIVTTKNFAASRTLTETDQKIEEFRQELAGLTKDEEGCLRQPETLARAEKDPKFKAVMLKVCQIERRSMELTNKDRARYCKNPLILEPRLAFVSRLNAVNQIRHRGGMWGGGGNHPHNPWSNGTPQRWFAQLFPRAAKMMRIGLENFAGENGHPNTRSVDSWAQEIVNSFVKSPGHHAPMIDCSNHYAGYGIVYDEGRNEWNIYTLFARSTL